MRKIIVLLSVLFLCGCATGGEEFTKLNGKQLVYGQTTSVQVREIIGRPFQMGSKDENGLRFETMAFAFSDASGETATDEVTAPARAQTFYFHEDKLVGTEFSSSFAVDSTNYDDALVEQIKTGMSTIGEVKHLFGEPDGERVFPLVKNEGEKAVVYTYSYIYGGIFNLRASAKTLIVYYDTSTGLVTDIDFEKKGGR